MKPTKLGTIWVAGAKIQRIEGEVWQTLATCLDTPNAIRTAVKELEQKGFNRGELWVNGQATGRKMITDLLG